MESEKVPRKSLVRFCSYLCHYGGIIPVGTVQLQRYFLAKARQREAEPQQNFFVFPSL